MDLGGWWGQFLPPCCRPFGLVNGFLQAVQQPQSNVFALFFRQCQQLRHQFASVGHGHSTLGIEIQAPSLCHIYSTLSTNPCISPASWSVPCFCATVTPSRSRGIASPARPNFTSVCAAIR